MAKSQASTKTRTKPVARTAAQAVVRTAARAAVRAPVRAVQRAFDLLALLGAERGATTLSELARQSALPVSTAARLLAALEHSGLVRRESAGSYAPGIRLMQIALASLRGSSLYDLSEPHLRGLSEASGETANLAVRADPAHAIYLRQVVSPHSIHHASWLGRMLPLRRTAVGAALSGQVDTRGYVARRNTLEPDVTAIAAPVFGPDRSIVAAFSITGPSFRISESDVERYGALVVSHARGASEELGGGTVEHTVR
jgi:DNA-binding IclR family transcriptional regulator